ncbi:MAG: hypothetical protein JXA91_00635 [Candidatus Thermoplasmatota archaeon]|nr:hypothetical protein [Candidatus Thermoplasmatota archaeon]
MADETSKNKDIEQLKNAEKKYQSYIERRNELNGLAKVLREERDMLNAKHKEIRETMDKTKKERDELVKKMKEHKEIRNKLQQQAKQIIEARRQKKGEVFKNLPLRVEELKADVQMLEYRQETVVMSSAEENELIDKIREKKIDYERTKKQMDEQKLLEIDISDKDNAITELFKKADEQHEIVQKFYNESQKKHKQYIELVRELSVQINESNKKHEQFIEIKNEAQRNHEKAVELRSRIISIRGEKRKQREDAKRAIIEQNKMARSAVLDEKKLGEIADKSVLALKKGQKITL